MPGEISEEHARAFLEKTQHDPLYFPTQVLGADLWAKQQEIVRAVWEHPKVAVRSCHGAGKDFVAARIVLSFTYSFPHSKTVTTAPTYKQVTDILWSEIRTGYARSRVPLGGAVLDAELKLADDWFATGISTNQPTNFQGYHAPYVLVVGDEAAGIDEPIFEAADSLLSTGFGRLLLIGNPTSLEGTFYKAFRDPTYHKIWISCFHTPNFIPFRVDREDGSGEPDITASLAKLLASTKEERKAAVTHPYLITPQWAFEKAEQWGTDSPMFQARVLGEFPTQSEDTLIPLQLIEAAARRTDVMAPSDGREVVGVDVARFGSDKTVFASRSGWKVGPLQRFSRQDTMQTTGQIASLLRANPNLTANIDDVGVGGGVVDRLKEQGEFESRVQAVNVGRPASDPTLYVNLRAEAYSSLKELFVKGTIAIPDDEELKAQLSNLKAKYTSRGQLQIESKEDMKKRGLPSPDCADALMLSFLPAEAAPAIRWLGDFEDEAA